MRIYIVTYWIEHDSSGNMGVYATEQQARDRVAKERRRDDAERSHSREYQIEVWDVGQDEWEGIL